MSVMILRYLKGYCEDIMNRYMKLLAHSKCLIIISLEKGESQAASPWKEVGRLRTGPSHLILGP